MNIKNDLILSIGYCQSVFCYYTTMPGMVVYICNNSYNTFFMD